MSTHVSTTISFLLPVINYSVGGVLGEVPRGVDEGGVLKGLAHRDKYPHKDITNMLLETQSGNVSPSRLSVRAGIPRLLGLRKHVAKFFQLSEAYAGISPYGIPAIKRPIHFIRASPHRCPPQT